MSDNIVQLPQPPTRDPYEFMVGPFEEWRCQIDGRMIPRLTAFRDGDDKIAVVLDHRFMVSVPKEIAHSVAWLIANAIAIGEGYSHMGAETKSMPFAPIGSEMGK